MSRDRRHKRWERTWHNLTAWNTYGEAIHSPYLFHLVRFVLGSGWFYSWEDLSPDKAERLVFRLVNELNHQTAGALRLEVCNERWKEVLQHVDPNLAIVINEDAHMYVRVLAEEKTVDVSPRDPDAISRKEVTSVFDYYDLMLLFYDPHYLKRTYRMKL